MPEAAERTITNSDYGRVSPAHRTILTRRWSVAQGDTRVGRREFLKTTAGVTIVAPSAVRGSQANSRLAKPIAVDVAGWPGGRAGVEGRGGLAQGSRRLPNAPRPAVPRGSAARSSR